ncbi:hypothetical protein [uncultured Legionella sp.]|uniref:hypothetical protein n=1 Tax=uncultured Legionella sp. TaxID=210934 RepID=UPI002606118A|nr:hypothetical protein [uncultured Legionella sp.]
MKNLPDELYHSQVVGKMSYIVNLLERIDPHNQCDVIRADFKEEVRLIKEANDFQSLLHASATGQCPDFDTLSKKSLVLQELDRLITFTPYTMKKERVESMYADMKNQNNLWSSFYHFRLNELEQLSNTAGKMPAPTQYLLEAALAKLQLHLSEHGIVQKDAEAIKLFQFAFNMKDLGYRSFETQLAAFKAFLNNQSADYSFADVLTEEKLQLIINEVVQLASKTISSKTLQNKLVNLKIRGIVDKQLFSSVDELMNDEAKLHVLTQVELDNQKLAPDEVEALFAKVVAFSIHNPHQLTTLLCDLALIGKAIPALSTIINEKLDSFAHTNRTEILNSEFLYQLISHVVRSKIELANVLDAHAITQTLNQLKAQLNNPGAINSNMNLNQLNQFINQQTEAVLSAIPLRKEKLDALGFGFPTFNAIEEALNTLDPTDNSGVNEIVVEFYTAIQQAKETHFQDNQLITKQLELISANDFNEFFKECSDAGKSAAQKLDGNRSGLTVVADVLKAIANWGIYLLSFGTTPQFFKAPRTAVNDVADAVNSLKATLTSTLEHLELHADSNSNRVANP